MKRNKEKQDRHFSIKALREEWKLSKDKKSAGIDNILPEQFEADLDIYLNRAHKSIYSNSFGFRELRVFSIPKGNIKPLFNKYKNKFLSNLKEENSQNINNFFKGANLKSNWKDLLNECIDIECLGRKQILKINKEENSEKILKELHLLDDKNSKKRIICIPTVSDRLIQRVAVRLLTKDKSKKYLSKQLGIENNPIVYGLGNAVRENSGVEDALKKAVEIRQKSPWVLKTDIQSFFDSIVRKKLIEDFSKRFKNVPTLTKVVEKAIRCEAEKSKIKFLRNNGIERGIGIRQGMPLSPILSSFFLRDFDKEIRKQVGEEKIIRYADDIIAFGNSEDECEKIRKIIEGKLNEIKLKIPSLSDQKSKTEIVRPEVSVTFLGMEIYKASDGRYGKRIAREKCEEIEVELHKELSLSYAIENDLTLSKLLQRFDSKKRGYKDAYKCADNSGRFMDKIDEIKYETQKKIMYDIFGQDLFDSLSIEKKKFLGFENPVKKQTNPKQGSAFKKF